MSEYRQVVSEGQADERQLQLLMKDWRGGRATRSILSILTDGYVTTFSILVIGAMIVSGVWSIQRSTAGCETAGCVAARGLTPWMLILGIGLIAAATAKLFGPVVASAAEGSWLLAAPIRRARFLSGRLRGMLLLGLLVGIILGFLVSLLSGQAILAAVAWSLATGFAASAVIALAAANQSSTSKMVSVVQSLLVVLLIALMLATIFVAQGVLAVPPAHWALVFGLAGGLAAVTVICDGVARSRLEDLDRYDLVSGGSLVESVQGAAFVLDLNLMRDILVGRHWLRVGNVKPSRGRGKAGNALIWREVLRLKRNPRPLILVGVSAIIPYTLASLGMGNLAPTIVAAVLFVAMVPMLNGLRMITRSKGLERCFPLTKSDVRESTFFVAILVTLLWVLITMPAFLALQAPKPTEFGTILYGVTTASVTGMTGVLAAIRWVTARPADYSTPMVSTAAGAVPPGLMINLFKGFDIVALGTLPLVLGLNPGFSMIILIGVYALLRSGGTSLKELNEQAADAQRELAEAKTSALREQAKRTVARNAASPKQRTVAKKPNTVSPQPAVEKKDRSKPRAKHNTDSGSAQ